jgi:hypothetical protein
LFGAAAALRERAGAPLSASDREEHARHVAAARAVLDEAAFEAAWAQGALMSQGEAIDYALCRPGQMAQAVSRGAPRWRMSE